MLQGAAGILNSQILNIYWNLISRFLTAIGGAGSFIPSIVFGKGILKLKSANYLSYFLFSTY